MLMKGGGEEVEQLLAIRGRNHTATWFSSEGRSMPGVGFSKGAAEKLRKLAIFLNAAASSEASSSWRA
jgi:hypothetical protein